MKVLRFTVHNVLRNSSAFIDMEGRHLVLVGGANGSGKTSALSALLMALCGKRGMDWPEISLKEGEKVGWVRVHLSGDETGELHEEKGFTVELLLRRRRGGQTIEELRVLDSTGEEAPEPRELLKRLYEFRAFDPLSFERAKPLERANMLRKLVGLDFSKLDAARKEAFEERTDVNRQLKAAEAVRDKHPIYGPEVPDKPVSVIDLVYKKEDAIKHNASIKSAEEAIEKMTARFAFIAEERAKLIMREKSLEAEGETLREECTKQIESLKLMVPQDINAIQEEIANCEKTNNAVRGKQQAIALMDEVSRLRTASAELTEKIEIVDGIKQKTLEEAEWPLPNMSVDDSGVLLDGLPFEQASQAQRVIASVKVGMKMNPKLRLLVCEDGNSLDNASLEALEELLVKEDFQLLMEFVTRSPSDEERCAVVFENGKPKGTDEPVVEAVAAEEVL